MSLPLILASGSIYRKRLLQQLQLDFIAYSPKIDETPYTDEMPRDMVLRLAVEKAQAAAKAFPEYIIISSDQTAVLGNEIIGKPHDFDTASFESL